MSQHRGTPEGSDVSPAPDDDRILLYDAKCEICNELAFKVRSDASAPVELVALSDPAAESILATYYPDGWSHDFYYVADGECRKGLRAIPSLVSLVGARNFGELVADYARYKRHAGQCGDDGEDHDGSGGGGVDRSRRRFTRGLSAAALAVASPLANVAAADRDPGYAARPPSDLTVHVATVRPDGDDFDVSIEENPELIRRGAFQADAEAAEAAASRERPASLRANDHVEVQNTGPRKISKATLDVVPKAADGGLRRAIAASAAAGSSTGTMTRYGLVEDRSRYGISLNLGRGPMVVEGDSRVATTLSGQITHDVPREVVDFVVVEDPSAVDLETQLEGYVAALQAYRGRYAHEGAHRLSLLYAELEAGLHASAPEFVDAVDGSPAPVKSSIGISSVPHWVRYVESPTESDASTQQVSTQGVDCSCGCCAISCCTDCGCGCSICLGTEPGCGCGCCIIGCGGGCGCGCCICA